MFIEEGYIHKKLPNSPYLIKYIESKKDNLIKLKKEKELKVNYHIFEYYENGTLINNINIDKNIKDFGEKIGRIIFKQILNSVEIIHKNGFAHQDIKLENILVSSNYFLNYVSLVLLKKYFQIMNLLLVFMELMVIFHQKFILIELMIN